MKKRIITLFLVLCLALTLLPVSALAKGNTEFPQVVTAFMKIKFECGCKTTGTGGMVGANGLITAGHNLICKNHNKPAKSIDFYFGAVSADNYWYKYSGKFTAFPFCDFSDGYTSENDIGLVKFPKKIAKNVGGWYGSQTRDVSEYDGIKGMICFYNADGKALIHKCDLTAYISTRLSFEHKPLPEGSDGSPIYFLRGAGRNDALIGVYTGYEDGKCIGAIITWEVFSKMRDVLSFELD